jgi:protein-disulfide isomerase
MKNLTRYGLILTTVITLAACKDTGNFSTTSSKIPKGNANSPVVVTEFADLQCPACKAAHEQVLKQLTENYKDTVRFEFKHFPLRQIHPFALNAAQAAECAADQGKFWEFIDLAYANQNELSNSIFEEWARAIGIADVQLFTDCIDSDAKRDLILAEYNEGRDLGVGGTPTIYVNGTQVPTTYADLSTAIDAEIAKAKAQR